MSRFTVFSLVCASCAATHASAGVITFEGFANGFDVEGTVTPLLNLSSGISSTASSGPGLSAAIFDSTSGVNAADPDLWVNSGNILIIQEDGAPGMTGNIYNNPNDEAGGGTLTFNFDLAVYMQSIMLVDVNGNNQAVTVSLFDSTGGSRVYEVPSEWTGGIDEGQVGFATLDLTSLAPQAGVGPVPTATTVLNSGLNPNDVVSLTVQFDGSGGLDNISFVVPSPASIALMGIAMIVGRSRRRRKN